MESKRTNGCLIGAIVIGGALALIGLLGGTVGVIALMLAVQASSPTSEDPFDFADVPPSVDLPADEPTFAAFPEPVADPSAAAPSSGVTINGHVLTATEIQQLVQTYGVAPQPGTYWYDPRSGQYGAVGGPVMGLIKPGHAFGTLRADASGGRTGVFLNGRQVPASEMQFYNLLLGHIQPGRYWLDAQGNVGFEGQPAVANLVVAAVAAGVTTNGGGGSGGSPADKWLSGNEFSGEARIGGMPMTSGTWDTSGGGNHVISVGGEVLNLPPY